MKEVDHKLIGRRIKEKRKEIHFTQEQLSCETELSVTFISLIESGKKKPSLGSLLKISNALCITMDELLSGNQLHNPTDYQTDIDILMSDCSHAEKRFIYQLLKATKSILRENNWIFLSSSDE